MTAAGRLHPVTLPAALTGAGEEPPGGAVPAARSTRR